MKAAGATSSMNRCVPVMMSWMKSLRFIDECWRLNLLSRKYIYIYIKKKVDTDTHSSTDPHLGWLVRLLQNAITKPSQYFCVFSQDKSIFWKPGEDSAVVYYFWFMVCFILKCLSFWHVLCLTVGSCYPVFLPICKSLLEKPVATPLAQTQAYVIVKLRPLWAPSRNSACANACVRPSLQYVNGLSHKNRRRPLGILK